MDAVRRRDDDRVDAVVLGDRERIRRRPRDTGGLRGALERHRVDVTERDDPGVGTERDARDVVGESDPTGADQRDSNHRAYSIRDRYRCKRNCTVTVTITGTGWPFRRVGS